ncbi:hypothetical protein GCM10025734_18040 [Kitasatospora paranensis]
MRMVEPTLTVTVEWLACSSRVVVGGLVAGPALPAAGELPAGATWAVASFGPQPVRAASPSVVQQSSVATLLAEVLFIVGLSVLRAAAVSAGGGDGTHSRPGRIPAAGVSRTEAAVVRECVGAGAGRTAACPGAGSVRGAQYSVLSAQCSVLGQETLSAVSSRTKLVWSEESSTPLNFRVTDWPA